MSDSKKQVSDADAAKTAIEKAKRPFFTLTDIPCAGVPDTSAVYVGTKNLPDWSFWRHMREVEYWKACALALNINPDSIHRHSQEWMAGGADVFQDTCFPNKASVDAFDKLMRLLKSNISDRQHFTQNHSREVRLTEFAAWCIHISYDIPPELAALAKSGPQATQKNEAEPVKQSAPAANVEAVTDETLSDVDWRIQARKIADECFDHDTNATPPVRDSLATKNSLGHITGGYSFRVMEKMQKLDIKGPRGLISNPATIMREALQGQKWWANKKK